MRMQENLSVRKMILTDIESISNGFIKQGWPGRNEILRDYFDEQTAGKRLVMLQFFLWLSMDLLLGVIRN